MLRNSLAKLIVAAIFAVPIVFAVDFLRQRPALQAQQHSGDITDSSESPDGVTPVAEGFNPRRLLPPIRPITEFPLKSVGEMKDKLADADLVLAVSVKGAHRAYPINMLTGPRREIINDELGGRSIAATW